MHWNILFIGCTHGDEPIGKYIYNNYFFGKNNYCIWQSIIANSKALKLKKRFIEVDLNRVFPGNKNGTYEEKRAYEINKKLSNFDLVVDWHQSNSLMNDIIFVPRFNPYLQKICQYFNINHIVELGRENQENQENQEYKGLLIFQVENGIAVEYANRANNNEIYMRVNRDINNLLQQRVTHVKKNIYRLFGEVSLKFKSKIKLRNFQKLTKKDLKILEINEDDIYPVFVNSYPHIYSILLQKIGHN